jgi:RNA polymerase sigma-70 factor (ECF subfamily)
MDIYRRYGPALMRKCVRMLGNVQDAEDIVQNLFIDLIKKGKTDVDLPYLYKASTNRCLNHIRNTKKRSKLLNERGDEVTPWQGPRCDEAHVNREFINSLVTKLDKKSREILVYRFYDDMSQEEIAQLTGYSRKTIGKKLQSIRQKVDKMVLENNYSNKGERL